MKSPNGLEAAMYAAIMKEARRTGQPLRLPGAGGGWYVPGIGSVPEESKDYWVRRQERLGRRLTNG